MPLKRVGRKRESLGVEKRAAERFGGKVQPSSGSLWHRKGDFLVGRRLIGECKSTRSKSIRVELEWLKKLERVALQSGRCPVLVLSFQGSREPQVVCLLFNDFEELFHRRVSEEKCSGKG